MNVLICKQVSMQNYSLTNKYVSPPMNISNCLVTYKYASTFFIPPWKSFIDNSHAREYRSHFSKKPCYKKNASKIQEKGDGNTTDLLSTIIFRPRSFQDFYRERGTIEHEATPISSLNWHNGSMTRARGR